MAATTSLERLQEMRPRWMPRWMFDIPDAMEAFATEHPIQVEEFRDGDELVIKAEMPGIDPDKDVEITAQDGVLRIRAERREHREEAEKEHYRSEFTYGAFSRALRLPAGTVEDDVKATYRDGVLEVRLPVDTGQAEQRRIPVTRV